MPEAPPSYRADPDPAFADRLERVLHERLLAPEAKPSADLGPLDGPTDDAGTLIDLDTAPAAAHHGTRRRLTAIALGGAAAAVLAGGLVATLRTRDDQTRNNAPTPTVQPVPSSFDGTWVRDDDVGSGQTMAIERSDAGYLVVVRDWTTTRCDVSGGTAVSTTTARLTADGALVAGSPAMGCDVDSPPAAPTTIESDPGLITRKLTYDPATDKLEDSTGVRWRRVGSAVWPQSTPYEVVDAQERADAGDPAVSWQVDPRLDAGSAVSPPDFADIEIFARYLREELGWESFRSTAPAFGPRGYSGSNVAEWTEMFIRCATDEINAVYPDDPDGRSCAPSSDIDNGYEHVGITVRQPSRSGPTGIWVVTDVATIWPSEQVVPPSDAEASKFVQDFLRARVEGTSVDEFLPDGTIPDLYTAPSGSPYERFEINEISPAVWALGERTVAIELFADNGATVTTEWYELSREPRIGGGGALRLVPVDEPVMSTG